MEETEAPSYLCLVKSTDHSNYSEDKLNKINSAFMKDHQKLKGIVEYSPYYFGHYIHMIRSKNWEEAEEYRKRAHDECEMLIKFLVTNGLRSEHQQKLISTVPMHGQTPLESNARKPQKGHPNVKPKTSKNKDQDKQKAVKNAVPGSFVKFKKTPQRGEGLVHNVTGISNQNKQFPKNTQEQEKGCQEHISTSKQTKQIVKKKGTSGKTNLVSNSTGHTSKTLAKRAILPVNTADSLEQNKHKNSHINAKKPTARRRKEILSKAKQIPGIAMTTNMPGKTEIAPDSVNNVHNTTITKSVQNSNTDQENAEGHLYHKDSGMLDATGSAAAEFDIMRRSEEASLLLVQGNPNIADLSDSNRPTKLAERYSELYSNDYTDAFEELKMKQISERDIIQILLNIAMHAYIYCQRKAKDESTRIQVEVQIDFKKQGYRSENAETLWKAHVAKRLKQRGLALKGNICQNFTGEELPKILRPPLLPLGNKLSAYVSASVEIVWMMCIRDPPLCMKWIEDENTEKEFDTDLFRFYTKSGKFVEYCVWPVLLLYDGGPLLTKGIAQGK